MSDEELFKILVEEGHWITPCIASPEPYEFLDLDSDEKYALLKKLWGQLIENKSELLSEWEKKGLKYVFTRVPYNHQGDSNWYTLSEETLVRYENDATYDILDIFNKIITDMLNNTKNANERLSNFKKELQVLLFKYDK